MKIYRAGAEIYDVEIDNRTVLNKKLMGEDKITCPLVVNSPLNLQEGDYTIFQGEKYYINRPPKGEKAKNNEIKYNIVFESEIYGLINRLYLLNGDSDFHLVGTIEDFIDLLVTNANRDSSGWTKGSVVATDRKNLYFDGNSCRSVLARIANEFAVEFSLSGRTINFTNKVETATAHVFEVGIGKGLYSLSRDNVDDGNTVTRAFIYGGSKNIDHTYRNGEKRLVWEHPTTKKRYLEDLSEYSKVVEKQVIFEDVYPHFQGTINQASGENGKVIKCTAIDFDINAQLMEGVTAKVSFLTGDLMGKELEIESYNHSTKEITLIPITEEGGLVLPGATFQPKVNDIFTLIDIIMPQTYITNAENELKAKGEKWLGYNKQLRVKYTLKQDPRHLRKNSISLDVGDLLTIKDTDLSIDKQIRVIGYRQSVSNPYDITAEIANHLEETWEREITAEVTNTQAQVSINKSESMYSLNLNKDWVSRNFAKLVGGNILNGAQQVVGDLNVIGNINQTGQAYITKAEKVEVKNNIMQLNMGEVGSQITGVIPGTSIPFSGMEINRGTPDPYYMGVVEGAKPLLKLGKKDSLEAIATRADSITDGHPIQWDGANKRMIGVSAVRDSLKLGGRNAADYWHKDNSGSASYDWNAKDLEAYGFTTLRETYLADNTKIWLRNKTAESWRGGMFWDTNGTECLNFTVKNTGTKFKFFIGEDLTNGANGYFTPKTGNFEIGKEYIYGKNAEFSGIATYGNYVDAHALRVGAHNDEINSRTEWVFVNHRNGDDTTDAFKNFGIRNGKAQNIALFYGEDKRAVFYSDISSENFASGFTGHGWRIDQAGKIAGKTLFIREDFTCNTFVNNKISVTNGNLLVSDNATIESINGNVITVTEEAFQNGDIVRCQQLVNGTTLKYYKATVSAVNGKTLSLTKIDGTSAIEVGDLIARWDSSIADRRGILYMSASDNGAPFYDVVYQGNTVARYGKLNGITDPEFGGLVGYGFYAENGFLSGGINATIGKIANWKIAHDRLHHSNNSIVLKADALYQYEAAGRILLGNWNTGSRPTLRIIGNTLNDYIESYYFSSSDYGFRGVKNGSNIFQLGSTNQIFGASFDKEKLTSGNVQIWKTGDIINTIPGNPFAFYGNGNFSLGKGQIGYNAATNVITLAASVKMAWGQITGTENIETIQGSQVKVDAIKVGALNHVINSKFEIDNFGWQAEVFNRLTDHGDFKAVRVGYEWFFQQTIKLKPNTTYTMTFKAKKPNGDFKRFRFSTRYGSYYQTINSTSFEDYTLTFNTGNLQGDSDGVFFLCNDGDIEIATLCIVEGNKSAGWSPAPEDATQTSTVITNNTISTTNLLAQNLKVNFVNIQGKLLANQIEALSITGDKIAAGTITTTKLAASTITAEKIATGAITADKLSANAITADRINGLTLTFNKGNIGGFGIGSSVLSNLDNDGNGIRLDTVDNMIQIYSPNSSTATHGSIIFGTAGVTEGYISKLKNVDSSNIGLHIWSKQRTLFKIDGIDTMDLRKSNIEFFRPVLISNNSLLDVSGYISSDAYIKAPTFAGRVYNVTGSGSAYLPKGYSYYKCTLSGSKTIYLPETLGVEDGTEITIFTTNNENAYVQGASGRLYNDSSSMSYSLDDNTNNIKLVKYGSSWYQCSGTR